MLGVRGKVKRKGNVKRLATRRLPFLHDEVIHLDESVFSNGKCNAGSTMPIKSC